MAEDENESEMDPEEGKKNKSNLILFLVMGVVLIIGIGITVYFLQSSDDGSDMESGVEEEVAEKVDANMPTIYIPLKPAFVVNFASPGSTRFLQVEVTFMARDSNVAQVVDLHMPLIRNNLITSFTSQSYDQIITPEGKEKMKEMALVEVQKIITHEYGGPGIEKVLFTSFVIQ